MAGNNSAVCCHGCAVRPVADDGCGQG